MGMYYRRLDYTKVVKGRHPIAAYEFLGPKLEVKDVILIDDMISSGSSILEIASLLKKRGAGKIFICTTFGLFTEGMEKFDAAYAKGTFDKLLTTNLVYQDPELLARDYYISCDLSKYIALIIDTLNHDMSVSHLLNPAELNFEMRTVRELEKRKRMKSRWITRQNKLEGGRSSLEEELREKNMELSNLTEELREMEEYAYLPLMEEVEIDALNLAMDTIDKLSEQMYRQTGNRLVRTMSETLRGITGGTCHELMVDDEFHISVDTGKEVLPIENLRLIMVEQIYLAMRLAAGELLCGAEKLPVIFDEMFCAFDPKRLETAVLWITGSGRQVIISTSKKQELDVLQKTGLSVNEISL